MGGEQLRKGEKMKLLTAVIAENQLQRVTEALDGAGLMATTVASAQAPGLEGRASLRHRGTAYRDRRCVRLEVLVSDVDAGVAVGLLATSGGPTSDGLMVWSSDVEDLAVPQSMARLRPYASEWQPPVAVSGGVPPT